MKILVLLTLLIVLLVLPLASAVHDIKGTVNDARDGEGANNHVVVLWNPANGIEDNLTDTIGPNGNSGENNNYTMDCELLSTACIQGDEIRIKVLDDGGGYITDYTNLIVTAASSDLAEDLTLNSPPNATLNSPVQYANLSLINIEFNCSIADLDGNLDNVTLYGNWTTGWHANETKSVSGTKDETVFTKNLSEGIYNWNCLVRDNLSASNFSDENFTITVDRTAPVISSLVLNETYVCGDKYVRVNCSVTDSLSGLDSVIIEAIKPGGNQNYSTQMFAGVYYSDVLVNELGDWRFNCIANDTANNKANLTSQSFSGYSTSPDLTVYSYGMNFSNYAPAENESVIVDAIVENIGCGDANNFLVGFYNGDPYSGGTQIDGNKTITISGLTNESVNVTWGAEIGSNNIFVLVDVDDSISEANESNNKTNKSLDVGAWQEFYGNTTIDKILSDSSLYNLTVWNNDSGLQGNIFITDQESIVNWLSLQAIGRGTDNSSTSDDFSDIDVLLGMAGFNDSVYTTFTDSGTPKEESSFLIQQKIVENVPVVNSTIGSDFITGILWDMADDDDGEYSQDDGEDLIFVAKVNKGATGFYGIYDYEITIPVKLREYDPTDSSNIYLYYDLV